MDSNPAISASGVVSHFFFCCPKINSSASFVGKIGLPLSL